MNNGKDVVKRAAVLCLGIGLIVTGVNFSTYAEQERSEEEILTEELQNYYKMRLSGFNSQYQDLACSINVCQTVAKENEERLAGLKQYEQNIGADFVEVECNVLIGSIDFSGTEVNIDLCENVSVYYQYSPEAPSEYFSFGTEHEVLLEKIDGSFTIIHDFYDECMISNVDTTEDDQMNAETAGNGDEFINPLAIISVGYSGYNAKAAIAYADTYAESVNSYYGTESQDCANFVSQCLHAGNVAYTGSGYSTGWYFDPSDGHGSKPWVNVAAFDAFWRGQGIRRVAANAKTLIPGNPFYYLPEGSHTNQHLMICVGYDSSGKPIYDAHNSNQYHAVYTKGTEGRTLYTLYFCGCASHSYSSIYGITATSHFRTCSKCGYRTYEEHTFVGGKCSVCGVSK